MTPVPVSISQEPEGDYEDVRLPTALTCARLDQNEALAILGGQHFRDLTKDLAEITDALVFAEFCLSHSAPHSRRAKEAHDAIGGAIAALDGVYTGIYAAQSAYTLGWGDQATSHRAGCGPHPPQPCAGMTAEETVQLTHLMRVQRR